jgi:hypothetical protein
VLARAYSRDDAALLQRFAPNVVYEPGADSLPVDFRRCRSADCAHAPDDPDLDATHSDTGVPAAAFTHVVRRGGETFLQYWFYYPYSDTALGPSHVIWSNSPLGLLGRYPGFHNDDWEGYFVRVNARGEAFVRASAHHGFQGCKERVCRNHWARWTGWTRVSKGSHAGHIPLREERTFARWTGTGRSTPAVICTSGRREPRRCSSSQSRRCRRACSRAAASTASSRPGVRRCTWIP